MTNLIYLQNSYLFKDNAKIIDIVQQDWRTAIILDQTIFYPQWWWQPADKWNISSSNWIFVIEDVRIDPNWIVFHYWNLENWSLGKKEQVKLNIDKERRILNAKLHSAGHLIDLWVQSLWLNIKAIKWYHFFDGCYVEFEWEVENTDQIISKLQETLEEMINKDLKIEIKELTFEEATKQWIYAPVWKTARIVNFQWCDSHGCGGTHVNSTKEIGKIIIKKIKSKKWNIQISYTIQ